jgi:hypothetical protein
MHEPYIAIYIDNFVLHYARKWSTEDSLGTLLEFSVDEVMSDEFDEASRKLGSFVLGVLRLWHPDVLNNWGNESQSGNSEAHIPNDFDVAMHLISKSVTAQTKVYVQSIDALLREQSLRTKAGHEFFIGSWPTIRDRLEKFT